MHHIFIDIKMNKHLKIICLVLITSSNTIVYGQPKTALSANKNPVLTSIAKQESALIVMSDKIRNDLAFLGRYSQL